MSSSVADRPVDTAPRVTAASGGAAGAAGAAAAAAEVAEDGAALCPPRLDWGGPAR